MILVFNRFQLIMSYFESLKHDFTILILQVKSCNFVLAKNRLPFAFCAPLKTPEFPFFAKNGIPLLKTLVMAQKSLKFALLKNFSVFQQKFTYFCLFTFKAERALSKNKTNQSKIKNHEMIIFQQYEFKCFLKYLAC